MASRTSPWPALAVLCAGVLMIILDGSIVTVALPAIQRDLHFSQADLTWTVNAYLIAVAGLLLLAGRLGDLVGHRRVFVTGLAVFTAASLLCGLSSDQGMLIAARFAQGVGGALSSAVSLGMIVRLFPEPRDRGRAIGAFSFVGAAGASIGQVVGGVLTEALNWHWVFFVNVPIGVAAVVLSLRLLEPDPARRPGVRPDVLGALLVTSGLMLGVYTIVTTPHTLARAALALLLLVGFVLRQAGARTPLLPLRVFRSRDISGANLIQLLMVSGLFAFQILIALYTQHVLGYGAAGTGLAMLPAAVTIGAVSLVLSPRLNARYGERRVLVAGLVLLIAALGLLIRLPVHGRYVVDLLPSMLLAGGFGLAISALTALGMADAAPEDTGVVSGLFNTTQQVGGALGVAVLSTLAASRTGRLLATGHDGAYALTGGFRLAFGVGTCLLVAALVLALTVLRRPRATGDTEPADVRVLQRQD